jgi:hypothetical protein
VGNLRERALLGDPGVDGIIILNLTSDNGMWVLDWIELALQASE